MDCEELTIRGRVYIEVDHPIEDDECIGCDLYERGACLWEEVKCMPDERKDNRNVIFVEKHP